MLTAAELRQLVEYDPVTGEFRRRGKPDSQRMGGLTPQGYRRIKLAGRNYMAHRLAFLYMTGDWPAEDVDHINRDKADNRWTNLREASRAENCRNRAARADNGTSRKGVHRHRNGSYVAQIQVDGEKLYLGSYPTADQAHAVYRTAARDLHGEFAGAF